MYVMLRCMLNSDFII